MKFLPVCLLVAGALASPTPTVPEEPTKVLRRQNLEDLISLFPDSIQNSINNGIFPDFFRRIPTSLTDLQQVLAGADSQLPVEVLNFPGYANFSDGRWNLRLRGQTYTRPYNTLPQSRQDHLADLFLTDTEIDRIPLNERENARNLTSYVLSYPAGGVNTEFEFESESEQGWSDEAGIQTDARGEFNEWHRLAQGLPSGTGTGGVVDTVEYRATFTDTGNATGFLVPDRGVTIISDVDDVLRVTRIFDPEDALLNTFARDFRPWRNMPQVYNNWASSFSSSNGNSSSPYHFHYLTTTPQQASKVYMSFIYSQYPLGSFDARPLNFSNLPSVVNPRIFLLRQIFETFPNRKFVLVGDTTNDDVMNDYPEMALTFPGQVQCILIRNTSATEPSNIIPYNTKPFEVLKSDMYMFFRTPDDIANLDFNNGDCVNPNVPQNLTFDWQGGPGGTWRDWIQQRQNQSVAGRVVASWTMTAAVAGLALAILNL